MGYLAICACSRAWGNAPVSIAGHPPNESLRPVVELLPHAGALSINQILKPETLSQWQTIDHPIINYESSNVGHWLHFPLTGLLHLETDWYLRIDYPHLDEIDVYFLASGRLLQEYHVGDSKPFHDRPIDHRLFLFSLNEFDVNSVDVYLRVNTRGAMSIPIALISKERLEKEEKLSYLFYGGFFGVIVVMFVYNLLVFLVVKDVSHIYYLLLVLATGALQFNLMGFGFPILWPNNPEISNNATLILAGIMPLTAIVFVTRFLKLYEVGTQAEKNVANLLCFIFAVNIVLGWLVSYSFSLRSTLYLSFISVCLGFYLGVAYWRRGFRAARSFAVAWFVYFVFISIFLLGVTGVLPGNFFVMHSLAIGTLFELTFLSLAFADRFKEQKELRIMAQKVALSSQKKLTKDLDRLVKARTEELERTNQELIRVSTTDGLTGLYNRRHFEDMFEMEYRRSRRMGTNLSILMIDVDYFKSVNDGFGHQAGDECLRRVAKCILSCIRRPPDLAARYGGEEFICLLPETDIDGAQKLAERVRQKVLQQKVTLNEHVIEFTVSIGVSCLGSEDTISAESLLKIADNRLYQAKEDGRNRVVWHAEGSA